MIRKKPYDGVIVAAHYTPQGEIQWVRAFERRGFVFSDRVLMGRETLVQHLQDGKRFKTGERMTYQGNDFKINEDVRLVEIDGVVTIHFQFREDRANRTVTLTFVLEEGNGIWTWVRDTVRGTHDFRGMSLIQTNSRFLIHFRASIP